MENQMTGLQKAWTITLSSLFFACAIGQFAPSGTKSSPTPEKIRQQALEDCLSRSGLSAMSNTLQDKEKIVNFCSAAVVSNFGPAK